MGRNRTFDEAIVVQQAAAAFLVSGYEGTSVEELVSATGLHRGSLYQAFGSKRGLMLTCLRSALADRAEDETTTDLVLVALLELAPRDREVRTLLTDHLESLPNAAHDLGTRLLRRAQISPEGAQS
jgi:TetR/AcrR family transcriptional repressor of nem operon